MRRKQTMVANKHKVSLLYASVFLLLFLFSFSCRQPSKTPQFQILLNEGWHIHSAAELSEYDDSISSSGFDVQNWYPAILPSTVLAVLVQNDVYRDPFFGKNLENIPTEQFKNPWWYRKEFVLEDISAFSNARLLFEGINYSANIWLNGKKSPPQIQSWALSECLKSISQIL